MKSIIMRRLFFYFLISFFLAQSIAFAQTTDETIHYARELTRDGFYDDAVEAYRRVLFFNPELTDSIARESAHAYRMAKNYRNARYYYNIAFHNAIDKKTKEEINIDILHTYVVEKDFMKARLHIANINSQGVEYTNHEFAFYKGLVFFATDYFDKSQNAFIEYFGTSDSLFITETIVKAKQADRKKAQTAMWLSILLPGLGQAYNSEYGEAVNSFLINSLFLSVYFYVAITYNPIQGFIAVIPWFQRYYIGGIKKARDLTALKKEKRKNELLSNLISISLNK